MELLHTTYRGQEAQQRAMQLAAASAMPVQVASESSGKMPEQ